MSPSESAFPALLKLHYIMLSLGSSQKNVCYETKMAGYFLSIYFPILLNNEDFSWAQGHLAEEFISQFFLKLSITRNHILVNSM